MERYPNVIGIGVAVPALLDPLTGWVLSSSHLEWKDIPLKERMDSQLPVPVLVLNNVKASAMAPVQATRLESGKSSFYMRIGEGVGGAILLNGSLYYGESWTAGEVGHLCVDREGPRCSCGRKGCLEALVRIPRVLEQLGQEGREWSDALGDGTMVAEERFHHTLAEAGAMSVLPSPKSSICSIPIR
ncbi:ROK family protein [Paenibacillus sp. CC-CFT747]|nr:ROK family protein [Paenibacillus sp. CC-CFT747]